jgi:hypothetical protein
MGLKIETAHARTAENMADAVGLYRVLIQPVQT